MKFGLLALAVAGALACTAPVSAAVIDYNATIELEPTMLDAFGQLIVPLPGAPIAISVGDTLEGDITFANDGRITVFDNLTALGAELISGGFSPDLGTYSASTGTFQLLGVEGDYVGPQVIQSLPVHGEAGFSKLTSFTNSDFSFTGIHFDLTYVDDRAAEGVTAPLSPNVTPFQLLISSPVGITVPEPATWALLILGFGFAGSALRRGRVAAG